MVESTTAGTIYDIGYQHYEGERLGRANAARTLIGYSLRAAFGIGRGERAKLVPTFIGLLAFAPVIVQIGFASATGDAGRISYVQQVQFTNLALVLFAASQAAELLVVDRQLGILSLYLSRSLRATDYALSKLAAMTLALLAYSLLPQLMLFAGAVFVGGSPAHAFATQWKTLGPIVATGITVAGYLAAVSLALSSLAARKGYASASVIAFFLLMPVIALMSTSLVSPHAARYAVLGNPIETLNGFARWAFGQTGRARGMFRITVSLFGGAYLYTLLGTAAAATGLLTWRYSRADV